MKYHPIANLFPLIAGAEFEALVDDIRRNGLREAIWLHPEDGSIIDGRNRHRACEQAGVRPRFRNWDGKGSLVAFTVSLNVARRHLTVSQRACLAVQILPALAAEARQRQRTSSGGKAPRVRQKVDKAESGRAAEKASTFVKVNRMYISDAAKLHKSEPALFSRVFTGELTLQEAKRAVVNQQKLAIVESIKREPVPFPDGKFRVMVIDPPWEYDRSRCAYPSMSLDAIKALPVPQLAHEDCVLFLWLTNAFFRQAFECVDAWGFQQKTMLTWAKESPGCGSWLRGQTEHCLMAVKGEPVVTLTTQSTLLVAPRREHSRKPDGFFALVESLCPATSRLEMFSRQPRAGWQAWGAETNRFAAAS